IGSMMTLGAYAAFVFNSMLHLPLLLAALLGCGLLSVIRIATHGAVFAKLDGRTSITLLVASIGVSFIFENVARFIFGNASYSYDVAIAGSYRLWNLRLNQEQGYAVATVLVAVIAVYIMLNHTALGRAMRAVSDNPGLAAARGINRKSVINRVWLVTGALTGTAGVLAGLDRAIDPQLGSSYLISVFAAAIVGGLGSAAGAVFGAVVIGLAEELSTLVISPNYREATGFVAIALILLLKPQGFFGAVRIRK
ncbi:MAG TPA: branched-chain amino acid ABC transporter permease, partial [Hyphomicrobiales bacterium]|nr:branched-chain amino acid ABC transporter permease [Hyphomicrobiales bacterium]